MIFNTKDRETQKNRSKMYFTTQRHFVSKILTIFPNPDLESFPFYLLWSYYTNHFLCCFLHLLLQSCNHSRLQVITNRELRSNLAANCLSFFSYCREEVSDRDNLKEKGFILAPSSKAMQFVVAGRWGRHTRAGSWLITLHLGRQRTGSGDSL